MVSMQREEILRKIKETESGVKAQIQAANEEKSALIAGARSEGDRMIRDAEKTARENYNITVLAEKKRTDVAITKKVSDAQKEIYSISLTASNNIPNARNILLKRFEEKLDA